MSEARSSEAVSPLPADAANAGLAAPVETSLLVITAAGGLASLRELLPDGIVAAEVAGVAADHVRLRCADGSETELRVAPSLCIGLVAFTPAGLALLGEVAARLAALGAFRVPAPVLISERSGALDLMLATSLPRRLRDQAAHAVRLGRELAFLRSTYEHVQNAFAQLEDFVASSGLQPLRLSFESLPAPGCAIAAGPGSVRQLLPVNAVGLSVLELHLAQAAAHPGGLRVELRALEDNAVLAQWEFAPAELAAGWLILSLPQAVSGPQRTPELILRPRERGGRLPPFSLGPPQPLVAFRTQGLPASERSLALRVWTGLPGVRPPELSAAMSPPDAAGPRSYEIKIPFSAVRQVRRVLAEWQPDFDVLELRPDVRGFLCHPGPNGCITLAALDAVSLVEPSRFTARATVHSAEAAPVEFGMAFSALPETEVKLLMEEGVPGAAGTDFTFTGWQRVVHGQPGLLACDLIGREGRLFFATRMADQAPQWFAWATFGDLRQVFLGNAGAPRAPAVAVPVDAPPHVPALPPAAQDRPSAELPQGPVAAWLAPARGIGFDAATLSIACPPPASGVALRRLPAIAVDPLFRFEAALHVANADAPPVEFAIAFSDLSAGEVLVRAASGARCSADGRLVFSGWHQAAAGEGPKLGLTAGHLTATRAHVFLMTRFTRPQRGARAAASFTAIRTNAPDQAVRGG